MAVYFVFMLFFVIVLILYFNGVYVLAAELAPMKEDFDPLLDSYEIEDGVIVPKQKMETQAVQEAAVDQQLVAEKDDLTAVKDPTFEQGPVDVIAPGETETATLETLGTVPPKGSASLATMQTPSMDSSIETSESATTAPEPPTTKEPTIAPKISTANDIPYGCAWFGACSNIQQATDGSLYCNAADCLCNKGTVLDPPNTCKLETNACDANPCGTAGRSNIICNPSPTSHTCSCKEGFTGPKCETNMNDHCASGPCANSGVCTNVVDGYSCKCPIEFVGKRCEYDDYCYKNPNFCKNGATCSMIFNGYKYKCLCKTGFAGGSCDQVYDPPPATTAGDDVWDGYKGCFEGSTATLKFSTYDVRPVPTIKRCYDMYMQMKDDPGIVGAGISGQMCYLFTEAPTTKINTKECDTTCGQSVDTNSWNTTTYDGADDACGTTNVTLHYYTLTDTGGDPPNPCDTYDCGKGMCLLKGDGGTSCICPRETSANARCTGEVTPCLSKPCKTGEECTPNMDDWTYTCVDPAAGGTVSPEETGACASYPCLYGSTCVNGADTSSYTCTCLEYYKGTNCEDVDYCVSSPCKNGSCTNVGTGMNKKFECTCQKGYSGITCDLNEGIYEYLVEVFGANSSAEIREMIKEMATNPSLVNDLTPFVFNNISEETRTNMSFTYTEMFEWATFEEKALIFGEDIIKWNDASLGNCFTFNHLNATRHFKQRIIGRAGGFYALLKVNSDEYYPWVETQAVAVFIHNKDESIFSESVRYNVEPRSEAEIFPLLTQYHRLSGKYGKCVRTTAEVKAYYYPGRYTTDGCLRSCYQDKIYKYCKCMDPRYPSPINSRQCDLKGRFCADDMAKELGDPSSWSDCICPLPCENSEFAIEWTKTAYSIDSSCHGLSGYQLANCTQDMDDTVLVSIALKTLEYKIFSEIPTLDINKFLSNLGGVLGILMGISVWAFLEVFGLLLELVTICCSEKR